MVIRFESKKDLTFPIVWGLIFFIYTAVGVGIVYTNNDYSALYSLACVWLGIGFLFVILLKTTYYTINDEHLVCHIFGFKKKVPINETGTAMAGIRVDFTSCKKINTTSETRMNASISVFITSLILASRNADTS